MNQDGCRVVILGAGPTGLGCALQLARRNQFQLTVLERQTRVGGNAGSFPLEGLRVDYGSHRLHTSCPPEVLADIRALLGADLLDRPRHGRIRLKRRWVGFPLRPTNLVLRLPVGFLCGALKDVLLRGAKRSIGYRTQVCGDSFASTLERGLGRTICREFYFPYAEKIWGLSPHELDGEQARRRVSGGTFHKLVRRFLGLLPGIKNKEAGRFYYPRRGYGQISEAYQDAAHKAGACIYLGRVVQAISMKNRRVLGVHTRRLGTGWQESYPADLVLSTLPLPLLPQLVRPLAPEDVRRAASSLRYRALVLIYLVLQTDRFTPFDAHYFPEREIPLTRLSEPKNYSQADVPGTTVLCGELPCTEGDSHWNASDRELGELVVQSLARIGLPIRVPVTRIVTRRLPQAYPIYTRSYRPHLETLESWVASMDNLLSLGRQGLFVHDNAHHALAMGYAANTCITENGTIDRHRWASHRRAFESHVVED